MEEKKLNHRHLEFVRQYFLNKRNATEAYRKVYPKCKNPDANAYRLMGNGGISAAIAAHEKEIQEKFEVTEKRIIEELSAIAFGHAGRVMDWDDRGVTLIPSNELEPKDLAFVEAVKETNGEHGRSMELKTLAGQKTKALELLGKHIGMWKDGRSAPTDNSDRKALLNRVSEHLRKSLKVK